MSAAIIVTTPGELAELVSNAVAEAVSKLPQSGAQEVLNLQGAAEFLGRHAKVVSQLVRDEELPAHYISEREPRFLRDELIEWRLTHKPSIRTRKLVDLADIISAPTTSGVYVVQGVPGYVKIGRAANIRDRMLTLQGASPVPLRLVAILSADPDDEAAFHERFANLRELGEWFRLEGELAEFLGATKSS